MLKTNLYCPGGVGSESGIASQSGIACQDRYPSATVISSGDFISDINNSMDTNAGPYVIPIWNSHQGFIQACKFIWDRIDDETIKIYDMWAKEIEFSLVKRKETDEIKLIISVIVAEQQCSEFLKNYKFEPASLTTTAFDKFEKDTKFHGVLIAPQSSLSDKYAVDKPNVSNDNNFTTFIKFYGSYDWECRNNYYLTAITTGRLSSSLNDYELALFDNMFAGVDKLSSIPRLIFVFELQDKVGLLFEGEQMNAGDLLNSEEISESDIKIYDEVGTIETLYSDQLKDFLVDRYPQLTQEEFLVHSGTKTYMFACPTLGIFTHGYDRDAVEPVFKFYMNKVFEAMHNGVHGTNEQNLFFKKHLASWEASPLDFMKLIEIK